MSENDLISDISAIQRLVQQQQFDQALEAVDHVLSKHPDHADALYIRAVCYRYLGRFDEALVTLKALQRRFPLFSRAFQEEGHLRLRTQEADLALTAFTHACRLNPALIASWKAQADLHREAGRIREAELAVQQQRYLEALPPPLVAVLDLISQGKLLKAEDLCRQFLKKNPTHVDGMRQLADIAVRLGVLDDAEFLLDSAVKLDPSNINAQIDYVQVLRKRQRFSAARTSAAELLTRQPESVQLQSLYAIVAMQTGDYDEALEYFDRVLAKVPMDPTTLTSKGHALKTVGRFEEAVDAYRSALQGTPEYGEAYFSLANLKTYRFSETEMSAMLALTERRTLAPKEACYVNFALGKAFEDAREFEQSFHCYDEGNRLKKAESRYESGQITEEFNLQKQICTPSLFAAAGGNGYLAPDPIFIVGLPRAGSTLLEQILASHSQVDGTLELPNILSLSQKLRRRQAGYPEILETLEPAELEEMGQEYIEDTRIHRDQAPFFIDKMPNNFRHIGLIKLILPAAKIIDARRHPMSCCFSGFKQLFAEGQEFSYSLDDIGRYYRDYVDLMDHWQAVMPGEILQVNHEDVVNDLETQVRRILEYCGLPFEQACVDYHQTERSVRTPSSEQVRQPIFRDSMDAWQNFEPWLGPLKTALGDELLARFDA